ncbi:MAG TPA: hypothetical protein VIW29_09650 [Polyangiaceae bacterium]
MQVLDFFGLERSLQDRFIEAASGSVPPKPLAFKAARPQPIVLAWWAGSVLGLVVTVGLLTLGFGSLESSLALLGAPWAVLLAGLVAFSVFAALRALALDHDRDSLPYRAGVYVFPIGVVDAQTQVVRIYRFPELKEVTQHERRVSLTFDGGVRFALDLPDVALAQQLVQLVEQHQQRVSGVSGPPSNRELAALDPLADTGFKSPFTPTERLFKSAPRWLRFGWVVALLAGAVLGPLAWKGRNFVSEEQLYSAARSLDTTAGYRAYLERGGQRSDVTQLLLPHAELKEAVAKGNVAALEAFLERGGRSGIDAEVKAELRKALLADLNEVAAKSSLTALTDFERAQKHRELIRNELELKRAELYQKAARAFAGVAQPSTPGLVGFFGRLLFYAQQHGPEVEIAFRRRVAESSQDAEKALQKSAYYMGTEALPSRYFRPEDWEAHEKAVGEALAERLNREFPPDILHFKLAPVLADDGSDVPKLAKPTLVITHRSELSGAFMSRMPRGAFVGLGLMVRSHLIVPGDEQPLAFKFSAWLPPDLKRWEQSGTTPRDVYEALARDGLDRYTKKQLAFLFKTP